MQATYRQLGIVESADQRVGAKNLAAAIPEVDSSRVGIWVRIILSKRLRLTVE